MTGYMRQTDIIEANQVKQLQFYDYKLYKCSLFQDVILKKNF